MGTPTLPSRRPTSQLPRHGLVVLLLVSLLWVVRLNSSHAQEPPTAVPPPAIAVVIPTFQYDKAKDRFLVTIGISGVSRVGRVIMLVREADQGVDVDTIELTPNNQATLRHELDTQNLSPNSKYQLRILLFDTEGTQLLRPADNGQGDPQEQSIWAVQEFTYLPGVKDPVAFNIESIATDYARSVLTIKLATAETSRPNRFQGFVVDEGNQRVLDITPTLYTGDLIEVPLPDFMKNARDKRKYTLTLIMTDVNGNSSQQALNFAPDPPPTVGTFAKLSRALTRNPLIPATIIIILFSLMLVSLMRNRPKQAARMSRPPVGQTVYMAPPPQQAPQAPKVTPAELRPPPPPPPAVRLRLRVLQSPGIPAGIDKIVMLPYIVGRAEFPNDRQISREHARIDSHQGHLILMDLGSTNGTFINEQRLAPQQPVQLVRQAQVRFGGGTVCELTIDAG